MFVLLPVLLNVIAAVVWTLIFAMAGEALVANLASDLLGLGSNRRAASPSPLVVERRWPSVWQAERADPRSGEPGPISYYRSC